MDEQSIKKIADTISDIKNASKQQVSSQSRVSATASVLVVIQVCMIVYILCVNASLVYLTVVDLTLRPASENPLLRTVTIKT